MTCKSAYVKQGKSATLEVFLSKTTSLDNEIWNIEHLNYSRNIIRNDTECQVLKHKIVKLETLGVYRYTVIIQKHGSSLSCNGTLLVYSK